MPKRSILLMISLAVAFSATVGVVGLKATFTTPASADSEFTFGTLSVSVSSDTRGVLVDSGAKTIKFPSVRISGPSTPEQGGAPVVDYADFTIRSTGTLPAHMTVRISSSASPGVELGKFTLVRDGGSGPVAIADLPVTDLLIDGPQTADIHDAIGLTWHDLTEASMGGSISLTLSINAYE
ncbi:MAG: hypothetical protein U0869_00125 [Chloroflexota bacterium]